MALLPLLAGCCFLSSLFVVDELRYYERIDLQAFRHGPCATFVNQSSTIVMRERGTYHAACSGSCLAFAPELISPSLDVVHAIDNHNAVLAQQPPHPTIDDGARLLLRACSIVDGSGMGHIVRGNNMNSVAALL